MWSVRNKRKICFNDLLLDTRTDIYEMVQNIFAPLKYTALLKTTEQMTSNIALYTDYPHYPYYPRSLYYNDTD